MEIFTSQIAETQVDHPWRRFGNEDSFGKICVFCHDNQIVGFRIFPQFDIRRASADIA